MSGASFAASELSLVFAQERLLKIFRITGLDRVFTLYDTVEAAVADGEAGPADTAATAG